MEQNAGDAMKYLKQSLKLLPEWFQDNQMMMNLDKCCLLLHGIYIKSTIVDIYSIKSSSNENSELFLLINYICFNSIRKLLAVARLAPYMDL